MQSGFGQLGQQSACFSPEQEPHPNASPAVSAVSRVGAGPPAGWRSAVPEPPAAGGIAS